MSPIPLSISQAIKPTQPLPRPGHVRHLGPTKRPVHSEATRPCPQSSLAALPPPQAPAVNHSGQSHKTALHLMAQIAPVVTLGQTLCPQKTAHTEMNATPAGVLKQLERAADDLASLGGDQLQALYMVVLHSANSTALRGHQALMETMSRLRTQAGRKQSSTLGDAQEKLRAVYEEQALYDKVGGGLRVATLAMTCVLIASSAGLGPAVLLMATSACLGAAIGAAVQGDVRQGRWSKQGALTGAEAGVSLAVGMMGLGGVLAGAAKAQQVVSRAPYLLGTSQAVRAFGQGMLEGLGRWAAPLGGITAELASASHVSSLVVGLPAAAVTQVGNLKVNLGTREVQRLQADAKHLELMMTGLGNLLRTGTQFSTLILRCHEQAMQQLLRVNDQRNEAILRIARNTAH